MVLFCTQKEKGLKNRKEVARWGREKKPKIENPSKLLQSKLIH